jgi:hypothetical protein
MLRCFRSAHAWRRPAQLLFAGFPAVEGHGGKQKNGVAKAAILLR